MYCPPFCNEQGKIPTTEQHLDVTGVFRIPRLQQLLCLLFTIKDFSLIVSRMASIHDDVFINISYPDRHAVPVRQQ